MSHAEQSRCDSLRESEAAERCGAVNPFIGYLSSKGKAELHSEQRAAAADWHHHYVIDDLDAYSDEGTITFVRMGGERDFTVCGTPLLDPHAPASRALLGDLAQRLVAAGGHPDACFKVALMHLPHAQAPWQGKNIGSLAMWAAHAPADDPCAPSPSM